ncbi:amidohydrolase family protein [Jiangella rhizosphaerae]|uniref:Amidohydrolase-related domain-containing protein n=1 Tax=Jiangella rhizosphaerae TaxID=2293569 RepID=A0A418KLF4_9ACTN|nr:hypothetical protein [Jiangella rhizosphaerae]RIQ18367.1 hypothetical protein DY240_21005 [Jiangella rhizosphaerae]
MRIFDAHRVLGPVPGDHVPSADVAGLLAELDHLGTDGAAVTPSHGLYGDPAHEHGAGPGSVPGHERLVPVPVILPAVPGAGWPDGPGAVVDAAPAMVRACPVRHRFALTGPVALRWWHELAVAAIPLALDASETGLDRVGALAAAVPELRILVLSPGYRCLRELAELLDAHPGIHVETGTLAAAGAVEWLARRSGAHRLVFGTGAPVWDDAGPRFQLDHLRLPAADVELIAAGSFEALRAGGRR